MLAAVDDRRLAALKHGFHGYWSRRITDDHRLVYTVVDAEARIASCRYHDEQGRGPLPLSAARVRQDPSMGHFFDALDGGPLRLELSSVDGRAFRLLRRIGYRSDDHPEAFGVPDDLETFRTDLASVPTVFRWLIPRTGDFLPAAVLHDGLVDGDHRGPRIDRFEADRIFRVAMAELGTGRVRAWLMWSAVTMGSMWAGRRVLDRLALVVLLGAVVALGTVATLDLVDVLDVLPWMGEASLGRELVGGAVAAAVIPAALALLWGRRWVAGTVVGVALAFLLHVTAAIALVTALYLLLERLVSGRRRPRPVTEATIVVH